MTKFNLIDGDMDYRTYEHIINGRMTKLRYKILSRYARKKSWRDSGCGHEWDCCGCMTSEYMSLNYIDGVWRITISQNFNY
jgi:hypothetical protein